MDTKKDSQSIRDAALHAPSTGTENSRLRVHALFTGVDATRSAVRMAAAQTRGLNAAIEVWVPMVVPYPLRLDEPPVDEQVLMRRYSRIFRDLDVECEVRIYLCRDLTEGFITLLPPRALVVLGAARKWWPFREMRIARRLRRLHHEVVLTRT